MSNSTEQLEPWEEFPHIWKTKSAFFTWLRSGLRKSIWQFYPPKLEYKNKQCTKPPPDYKGKAKTGAVCSLTGEWTGKSYTEIDHLKGHVSLKDWHDVLPFVRHLCAPASNMAIVSKEAHKIKSYAERMNITFEEAILRKQAIAFGKMSVEEQTRMLKSLSLPIGKTKKDRQDTYSKWLEENAS